MSETLNPTNLDMVNTYLVEVQLKKASGYMLTIARDGESPVRSIYFYDNAIDAVNGYEAYQDWGFAKEYLTVSLYEPTGQVHTKTLRRPRGGECTFLKNDYLKITEALLAAKLDTPENTFNQLILEFAKIFSRDNQRFDHERFLSNLGYTGEITDGYRE
jgi:hypothetical protein